MLPLKRTGGWPERHRSDDTFRSFENRCRIVLRIWEAAAPLGTMEVLKQTSKEAAEVKLSRNAVRGKANRALEIRFEAQRLTSHAGLVVFQRLFARLGLKERLRPCFRHLPERAYPPHAIVLLLVVHLLLGCRGLRDMARYRNDEAVRRAEGAAAGYNPRRKGQRSYWPLFATVAQTSQALDVLHRPGNVADSTGAREFMDETLARLRGALPGTRLEARADGAFFGEDILDLFERRRVDYSVSVPFERFPALRQLIESQTRWRKAGRDVECFEPDWKPNSWASQRRIVVIRRRVPIRRPGPLQLDLFEPRAHGFEFKAVVTNKRQGPGASPCSTTAAAPRRPCSPNSSRSADCPTSPPAANPPTACSRSPPCSPTTSPENSRWPPARRNAAPTPSARRSGTSSSCARCATTYCCAPDASSTRSENPSFPSCATPGPRPG